MEHKDVAPSQVKMLQFQKEKLKETASLINQANNFTFNTCGLLSPAVCGTM